MIKKQKPVRSFCGEKFRTTHINKKYLATDFSNRCAYCDDLDLYGGGYRAYHVEHFAPKEKFPELEHDYDNLLYACPWCNRAKWNLWPSDNPKTNVISDIGFLDPCTDEYYLHLDRNVDGTIRWQSRLGKYIYETLHLYLRRHEIIYNIDRLKTSRDNLIKSIEEDESVGKKAVAKKEAMTLIDDEFFKYFNLWQEIS